jgi:hemerythrin
MNFIDPKLIPATGNPEIDRDHRILADVMNHVYSDWQNGMRCPELAGKLEVLRNHLTSHFGKEITIARGAGYQRWLAHHHEHKDFLNRFDQFLGVCKTAPGPDSANIEMFMELESHLFEHEVLSDQDMWSLWEKESAVQASERLIDWKPAYSVGIEQIDGQHQRLVVLLNAIHQNLKSGVMPLSAILERLKVIYQEAVQHFRSEEQYFSHLPEPMADQHRRAHESLLKELKAALDDHESADVERVTALLEGYLKFWLLDHILNTDNRLREYIK